MDSIIQAFPAQADGDLTLCVERGVAYQTNMASAPRVPYDDAYLAKCEAYADGPISKAINNARCALILRHAAPDAALLDIGAGSGAFMRCAASWGLAAKGFDVIEESANRLRAQGLYADNAAGFDVVTMWDVMEHLENPADTLRTLRSGTLLFVSIPVFPNLVEIRSSKHYRPGEHLYYWTAQGFVAWMHQHGFNMLEESPHETDAGRDSIAAFAFQKVLRTCRCGQPPQLGSFDWPQKPRAWYVKCYACHTVGPMADAPVQANTAWNTMEQKPCSPAS